MGSIPSIDYFSRDFESIRSDLTDLIPFFTPEWTDRNANDLGIVIIELFAYMGDVLHFYIDRRAQDMYLPTAFTRQSVVNILKLIDYNVPGPQAATADELFEITDPPYDEDITIPRATSLQAPAGTGDTPVQFDTLDEYIFAYTTLTANVTGAPGVKQISVANSLDFQEGQIVNLRDDNLATGEELTISSIPDSSTIIFEEDITNSYTTAANARVSVMKAEIGIQEGNSFEELVGTSDGSTWQIFSIPKTDVIQGSIEITVNEGIPELWTEIESLGYATPNEKVYEVSRDFEGFILIRFGNGSQGKVPDTGASITAFYRTGGGIIGNVGADKITTLLDTISSSGGPVSFSVTNPEQSSGGAEEQSISNAKLLGPKSIRALGRAVTLEDYETLARNVTGVKEASAVRRGSPLFREIDIYILPEGGYSPSDALISEVTDYLSARDMAGETIYVQGPTHVVGILLNATVYVISTADSTDVRILVETALSTFFSVDSTETQFGKNVNLSDVMALIDNVPGVDHVDVSQLTLNPEDTFTWEVAPDDPATVAYIVGLNVDNLIDQTYTLTFTSPTTYDVVDSGAVNVGSGTLDAELVTTDGALKIRLDTGTDAMAANDRAIIRTSQYVGNVEIEDFEVRRLDTQTLTFEGGA